MGKHHRHGVESTAAILHHPIHPMLIPIPATTLLGVVVTDIVYLSNGNPFWAEASWWLLLAGLISGVVAAIPGLIDMATIREVRELPSAYVHGGGNLLALVLTAANFMLRDDHLAVDTLNLGLSIAVAAILGVTAWLGGELSYRHRIGIIADDSDSAAEKVTGSR